MSHDVMTAYCNVTKLHIIGTTCYIEMSEATCDSQTRQKVFRQEPEEAAEEEAEAEAEDSCHPE